MSFPPEIESYFAQQRLEQQQLNKTAHVKKNLRETQTSMHNVMEKLIMRGHDLKIVEEDTQQLLDSSNAFLIQSNRMNWSCLWSWVPGWWCQPRQKLSSRESTFSRSYGREK